MFVMRHALRFVFRFATLTLLAAGVARTAAAQSAAGSFESLQSTIAAGTVISVEDDAGQRTTGRLLELSANSLALETLGPRPRRDTFAADRIVKVTQTDSNRDGFWKGFALGAIPGVVLGSFVNRYCYNESPHHCPAAFVVLGGLTGLAGGAIGWSVDSAVKGGDVLFSRAAARPGAWVRPFATPESRGGGLAFAVAF